MPRQFIFFLAASLLFSCHTRMKFDKAKWAEVADLMTFPNRKFMVDDLTKYFQLKGKRYNEIVDLLGKPQGKGDNDLQIFYDISVDYGSDIDPVYSKTLKFQFDSDSIVQMFEISEWRK